MVVGVMEVMAACPNPTEKFGNSALQERLGIDSDPDLLGILLGIRKPLVTISLRFFFKILIFVMSLWD